MKENNIKSVQKVWGIPKSNISTLDVITDRFEIKHGMFASIPLICRCKRCPYAETCPIPENQRITGQRCYVEIGAILSRFDVWCAHFKIDNSGDKIKDEDAVDVALIRDLIDIEIQIMRAENKLAINGDFIGDTLEEVDKTGTPWYNKTVTPEAEYKLTLLEKRQKILNQLNATRKDKANQLKMSQSTQASNIFNDIQETLKKKNIDLDDLDLDTDDQQDIQNINVEGDINE